MKNNKFKISESEKDEIRRLYEQVADWTKDVKLGQGKLSDYKQKPNQVTKPNVKTITPKPGQYRLPTDKEWESRPEAIIYEVFQKPGFIASLKRLMNRILNHPKITNKSLPENTSDEKFLFGKLRIQTSTIVTYLNTSITSTRLEKGDLVLNGDSKLSILFTLVINILPIPIQVRLPVTAKSVFILKGKFMYEIFNFELKLDTIKVNTDSWTNLEPTYYKVYIKDNIVYLNLGKILGVKLGTVEIGSISKLSDGSIGDHIKDYTISIPGNEFVQIMKGEIENPSLEKYTKSSPSKFKWQMN